MNPNFVLVSSRLLRLLPDLGRRGYLHPIKDHFGVRPGCDALGSEFEPNHVLVGVHFGQAYVPKYIEEWHWGQLQWGCTALISPQTLIALAPQALVALCPSKGWIN